MQYRALWWEILDNTLILFSSTPTPDFRTAERIVEQKRDQPGIEAAIVEARRYSPLPWTVGEAEVFDTEKLFGRTGR